MNGSESLDGIFDELKRRLEALAKNPSHDNEATRHDRLVLPFLTHPMLLGWNPNDVVAQASIRLSGELRESYIFRDAEPKFRRPDVLVMPTDFQFNAFVVEEKAKQDTIAELNEHRLQLLEYQALFDCVWGLLTDGDKWILRKGFESYHTFESLDELRSGIKDIQQCIGKHALLERQKRYGTCDLVVTPGSGLNLGNESLIYRVDSGLRVSHVNDAYSEFVGLTKEELIGLSVRELYADKEVAALYYNQISNVFASHRSVTTFEEVYENRKGELWVLRTERRLVVKSGANHVEFEGTRLYRRLL